MRSAAATQSVNDRSPTMGSWATPGLPPSSPPTDRSTGCACLASTATRCSDVSSVVTRRARSASAPPTRMRRSSSRRYLPGTATLETTWTTSSGRLTLTEGMIAELGGRLLPSTLLVRRLSATGGPVEAAIEFDPRMGEGRRAPRTEARRDALVCTFGRDGARPHDLTAPRHSSRAVPTRVVVDPGSTRRHRARGRRSRTARPWSIPPTPGARCRPTAADGRSGAQDDRARRSASRRGAPQSGHVAAAHVLTIGRPGGRADHLVARTPGREPELGLSLRLARDASIGVAAFLGVGKERGSPALPRLVAPRQPARPTASPGAAHPSRPPPAPERRLEDWPGYAGSRPVRDRERRGRPASARRLRLGPRRRLAARRMPATICIRRPGVRSAASPTRSPRGGASPTQASGKNAVSSHTTCIPSSWRGWRSIARSASLVRTAHRSGKILRWQTERDAVAAEVRASGFNPQVEQLHADVWLHRSRCRSCSSSRCSNSNLGADHGSAAPSPPSLASSTAGGPLLYRYPPGHDGLPGVEGAFLPCSFWYAQALAATGDVRGAEDLLDRLVDLATPLGLYAEELEPSTHAHLGNFPQALTHAGLVQATLAIRRARHTASLGS